MASREPLKLPSAVLVSVTENGMPLLIDHLGAELPATKHDVGELIAGLEFGRIDHIDAHGMANVIVGSSRSWYNSEVPGTNCPRSMRSP